MYMLRPISIYLDYMLSILVICGVSAVVQEEELAEILRGPTTPSGPRPPNSYVFEKGRTRPGGNGRMLRRSDDRAGLARAARVFAM